MKYQSCKHCGHMEFEHSFTGCEIVQVAEDGVYEQLEQTTYDSELSCAKCGKLHYANEE